MKLTTRIWLRYRVSRIIYITARASGFMVVSSLIFAVFEFMRPNPVLRVTISKAP